MTNTTQPTQQVPTEYDELDAILWEILENVYDAHSKIQGSTDRGTSRAAQMRNARKAIKLEITKQKEALLDRLEARATGREKLVQSFEDGSQIFQEGFLTLADVKAERLNQRGK